MVGAACFDICSLTLEYLQYAMFEVHRKAVCLMWKWLYTKIKDRTTKEQKANEH